MTRKPAPSAHSGPRAPFLGLLAGGVVAGFGLGALALALLLPAPQPMPLPGILVQTRMDQPLAPDTALPSRLWPAAFGTPPRPATPQPAFAPSPAPADDTDEEEEYLPYTDYDYLLRGMVAQEGGGWALIESEIGVEVVRVGSELSGGETVIEITPHGVILQGYGPEFLLSFSDDADYDIEDGISRFSVSDALDDGGAYGPEDGPDPYAEDDFDEDFGKGSEEDPEEYTQDDNPPSLPRRP
ncbi:hypothetical protein [Pararhodobacter sp.]|uniref:hypothetical protein n=1 Tax=Pararhodobacter sp. TaxID=2127056 RepID=UPI002FDE1993